MNVECKALYDRNESEFRLSIKGLSLEQAEVFATDVRVFIHAWLDTYFVAPPSPPPKLDS